jgi:hypothetical protein
VPQQMDTTTILLIGVGGYLAYAYIEKLWPFNVTVAAAVVDPAAAAAAAKAAADKAAVLAAAAQKNTGDAAAQAAAQKAAADAAAAKAVADQAAAAAATAAAAKAAADAAAAKILGGGPQGCPAAGTVAVLNGISQQADGKCGWTVVQPAPQNQPLVCTGGLVDNGAGACVPAPPIQTTLQKMAALASGALFSTDEWCYFYTQISGNACPVDPGNIDPTGYNAVGANLTDGTIGDRTTPITIDQWYQLMQNQVAGFSLSGLGMFVPAFVGGGIGSPWLL